MTRIVWNDYIRHQLHWAERLGELARERQNGEAEHLALEARRAFENAHQVSPETAAPEPVLEPAPEPADEGREPVH